MEYRNLWAGVLTDHLRRDAVVAGPTAQIIVGSGNNAKTFHLHKKLLCECSTYFNAALNNGFAETKDQVVNMDDGKPDISETFTTWLYEGKLNKVTLPSDDGSAVLEEYLFRLYVFADKRGIGDLANDTITMLASYWAHNKISLSDVTWVIILVSRKSTLYNLILDCLVLELRNNEISNDRPGAFTLPAEFLIDLLLRSNELPEHFDQFEKCLQAVCHYHCHEGQGVMSEEHCIKKVEAGCNIYYEYQLQDVEQLAWDGHPV